MPIIIINAILFNDNTAGQKIVTDKSLVIGQRSKQLTKCNNNFYCIDQFLNRFILQSKEVNTSSSFRVF